jgi:F-type H+-transporting ATPase subunit delta
LSLAAASRYAKALVDIVRDPKSGLSAEAATVQLASFQAALQESRELRAVLITPAVSPAKKRAVVTRVAGTLGLHPLLRSFLCVLIDHRRTPIFDAIRSSFQNQIDDLNGIVRPAVVSSQELNADQRSAMEGRLARMTGKTVHCTYSVNPALLGGVTVTIGSKVYDGSVSGQLDALRRRFAGAA